MKKKYVAPSVEEQEIATVQMICTSLPVNNKNGDDKLKTDETLSNGNNDSWDDWDNSDDDK